ncbi:MAG: hypothetical protein CL677_08595 [Bdellovibrionaceae bacterium]|nr:hypothetical protein [Pseudobdellovibrionaceae bacterium]|tara:strand:+ start:76738 stop:78009 length:1272 start_codon:yes stop_codon:yes gene_type:complete
MEIEFYSNGKFEASQRAKNVIQIIKGYEPDIENLSVLDVAPGSSCMLLELVKKGINYSAIEVREQSCKLLTDQLSLYSDRVEVKHDNLSNLKNVVFNNTIDITLMAGIFYHLSPDDQSELIKQALSLSGKSCIIDTLYASEKSLLNRKYSILNGIIVEGYDYFEHTLESESDDIERRERCSYQNGGERYPSFIMTEDSMVRLLKSYGVGVVNRVRYAPNIAEVPARPIHDMAKDVCWTGFMIHERGILHFQTEFLETPKPGMFEELKGDFSSESVVKLVSDYLNSKESSEEIYLAMHELSRQLPMSMHGLLIHVLCDLSKVNLSLLVNCRMFMNSYLKSVNSEKEDIRRAQDLVKLYLSAIASFSEDYAKSMGKSLIFNLGGFLSAEIIEFIEGVTEAHECFEMKFYERGTGDLGLQWNIHSL